MAVILRELSPQLWLVLVIVLFNSFKYFALSTVLTLFVTIEYGMSDIQAGNLYGIWGLMHTVWGFVGSLAVDRYGIRRVALVATSLGVISRGLLVFLHSEIVLRVVLCGIGPIAEGVIDPLYMVAIKKLTRRRVRGLAFGLQYAFMNLGGACAENFVDCVRLKTWTMPWGQAYSGLRFALFGTWLAACMGWFLALWLRSPPASKVVPHWSPGLEGNAFNQQASAGYVALIHPSPESSPGHSPRNSPNGAAAADTSQSEITLQTEEDAPKDPIPIPKGLTIRERSSKSSRALSLWEMYAVDRSFHRAVFMTAAVMFVSFQWKYMDTLLPKFADRTFGAECPWGGIYSINNWMCVICPPVISAMAPADRVDDFQLIVPGLWIMALSPICIWASVSELATAAWVFLLSCGEVLWSPRSQSFIASLAPDGREGAFLALANAPNFLSQYPVGFMSGWLLDTYCPACPHNHSKSCTVDSQWKGNPGAMWLWVAVTSAVSPVIVTSFVRYLRSSGADCQHTHGES